MTSSSETTAEKLKITPIQWISVLLACLAIGLTGITLGYFYTHTSTWQASFLANTQSQSLLEKKLKHQDRTLNTVSAQMAETQIKLNALNNRFIDLQGVLQNQANHPSLAHALFLIQLAEDSLSYQFDLSKAKKLLQQALDELNQNVNPDTQGLIAQLQETLKALEKINPVNTVKLMDQLFALEDSVETLPLTQTQAEADPKVSANTAPLSFWQRALSRSWQGLKNLVTIKHYGEDAPHFVTPDERAYLNARLCLYLNQAQWAVLSHDTALFKDSLSKAALWLNTQYDNDTPATQTMKNQIENLSQISLQSDFPNLSPLIQETQSLLLKPPPSHPEETS